MDQRDLSPKANADLAAVQNLPQAKQVELAESVSAGLASRIDGEAQTATPEECAKASLQIREGIQAARDHGFGKFKAPDGTDAITVKITRSDGTEVTCLLSKGASGKRSVDLAGYGHANLNGASLLTRVDFEAVVVLLFGVIKGQKVVHRGLQTKDAALQDAYEIVTRGVRWNGGFSKAVFKNDDSGAVASCCVDDDPLFWYDNDHPRDYALFSFAPPKSDL
jgi:hypothetical protein